jgi:hypothetical protein
MLYIFQRHIYFGEKHLSKRVMMVPLMATLAVISISAAFAVGIISNTWLSGVITVNTPPTPVTPAILIVTGSRVAPITILTTDSIPITVTTENPNSAQAPPGGWVGGTASYTGSIHIKITGNSAFAPSSITATYDDADLAPPGNVGLPISLAAGPVAMTAVGSIPSETFAPGTVDTITLHFVFNTPGQYTVSVWVE